MESYLHGIFGHVDSGLYSAYFYFAKEYDCIAFY